MQMKRMFSTTPKVAKSIKDFPFLKQLGIKQNNNSVFHSGELHKGRGPSMSYSNPASGQVLCNVRLGNQDDYNDCVEAMAEERDRW